MIFIAISFIFINSKSIGCGLLIACAHLVTVKMASLPEASYKGTEFVFLGTAVRTLEQLKCSICLELVSEPVATSCKHLFCGSCIKDLSICPKCRTKGFKTSPDFVSTGVIEGFKVKCPNSTEGCEWQGELGDAIEHLEKKCEQQTVDCPLGCGEKMKRRLLENHTKDHCPNRPFNCPHCGHSGVYKDVTSIHYTTCEEFPLPCPGGCHERITRGGMKRHLLECPEEYITCKYAMFGCDEVVKRRESKVHFDDDGYHLKQSLNAQVSIYGALGKLLTSSTHIKADLASLPLSFRPWLQNSPTCYPRPPWVVKLEGYHEKTKRNEEAWVSQPVYSHFGGYKMCLGCDSYGSTHFSVFAELIKGGNDHVKLELPFKGTITVSLLNQEEDSNHHPEDLWKPTEIKDYISGRVTISRERLNSGMSGRGCFQLSHNDLGSNSAKNTTYLKSDSLFFRVDKFEPAL